MPDRSRLAARLEAAGHAPEAALRYATLVAASRRMLEASGAARETCRAWVVPGRVEVLGKHTDYAGGRSLLCAADRGLVVLAAPIAEPQLVIEDVVRGDRLLLPLAATLTVPRGWGVYPATVARRLVRNFGAPTGGVRLALASDLPSSAGLSSSSALVVATALAIAGTCGFAEHPLWQAALPGRLELAGYLGAVENGAPFAAHDVALAGEPGVGTMGGAQDHTAILGCAAGQLDVFRWRPVRHERSVPFPDDLQLVVGVSGVTATKTGAARTRYNRAARLVQHLLGAWAEATGEHDATLGTIIAQGDAAVAALEAAARRAATDEFTADQLLARIAQFRFETDVAVPGVAEALARGAVDDVGRLVAESQARAESALGNQVPETVALVRTAREVGAIAASAFGAGFGGSVWALVPAREAERMRDAWRVAYRAAVPAMAGRDQWFAMRPAPPADVLPLD